MPISPEELNLLIFRYLQESGLTHTAFMFGHESRVLQSTICSNSLPPGALANIVVKGLFEIGLEANMVNLKKVEEEEYTTLDNMELITKDIGELRKIVQNMKKEKYDSATERLRKKTDEGSSGMKDMRPHNPGKQSTWPTHNPGKQSTLPTHNPGQQSTRPTHNPGKQSTRSTHNPGKQSTGPTHNSGKQITGPTHNPGKQSTRSALKTSSGQRSQQRGKRKVHFG